METTYMDTCLNDKYLEYRIEYLAFVIARKRPNTYSIEDGKQILWEVIINASKKYDAKTPIIKDARRAIYSAYGNLSYANMPASEKMYEYARRFGAEDAYAIKDSSFSQVETSMTIDNIEAIFKAESQKSKHFKYVGESIKYLRNGLSMRETSEILNISTTSLRKFLKESKQYLYERSIKCLRD